LASLGTGLWSISTAILAAMLYLALLTVSTGILRKKWLGIAITGLLLVAQASSPTAVNVASTAVFILIFMVVLLRFGLIASTCLCLANWYGESILPVIALRKWTGLSLTFGTHRWQ
jgi:hypothetical protein